jgi:hypothetical protein
MDNQNFITKNHHGRRLCLRDLGLRTLDFQKELIAQVPADAVQTQIGQNTAGEEADAASPAATLREQQRELEQLKNVEQSRKNVAPSKHMKEPFAVCLRTLPSADEKNKA